jgi:pimeloyl-ACP methyl ester carboxylesterase
MFIAEKADPALEPVRKAIEKPITVPTLALCGTEDKRAEVMREQDGHFAGEYRFELVDGCSHFLHREQPEKVTQLVLDWLGGHVR